MNCEDARPGLSALVGGPIGLNGLGSPDKPPPPKRGPRRPPPEELARTAIAHEETAPGPGGKVRITFRVVVVPRPVAEALVARSIREEKNIGTLVTEMLEAAARKGKA
jgi:hypothetical protein